MAGVCCIGIAIGEGIIGGAIGEGIAIGVGIIGGAIGVGIIGGACCIGITEIGAMFTSPIITGCALDAGVASITLGRTGTGARDARPAPIRAGFSMEGPSMGAG